MKTIYMTTGMLVLAALGLAQSSAPVAANTTAAKAQHFAIQVTNPNNKDSPTQAFMLGPDDIRIELLAGPNLTTVSENHQVPFFTPDIDAMPVTGTKGRALDHLGFEMKDLESFCKNLEASGVKLDTPYRKVPQMGFAVAFLTDPWGTRIELTERSAQSRQPAQQ